MPGLCSQETGTAESTREFSSLFFPKHQNDLCVLLADHMTEGSLQRNPPDPQVTDLGSHPKPFTVPAPMWHRPHSQVLQYQQWV